MANINKGDGHQHSFDFNNLVFIHSGAKNTEQKGPEEFRGWDEVFSG